MSGNLLPNDIEAKELILDIGKRMYDKNYCAANDGNISCKTREGFFWITPTGVSKGFMTAEMLVKTDIDGNIIEASDGYRVSSEIQMHMSIYKKRHDVNGVVHAHPLASTAFACARRSMDIPVVNEALLSLGEVPCAPFAKPGTKELAESIEPYIDGHAAVLLSNHGVTTWGESMIQAYYRLETVEYYANMLILTGNIPAPAHILSAEERETIEACREKYGIRL